jgi:hypothetical protein
MSKLFSRAATFDHIQAFLDDTHGQITIGQIPPIRRAALAAQGKHPRVSLVGRPNETIAELLQRLDVALADFIGSGTITDEVLPEIKRQRGAPKK